MSAKDFCIVAYYIRKLGAPGDVWNKCSLEPGRPSGRYRAHLRKVFPASGPYYRTKIPASSPSQPHIRSREVIFRQVHHSIAAEVVETDGMLELLSTGPAPDDHSSVFNLPCYREHPLAKKSLEETGKFALPLGLYADGIRYTPVSAGRIDHLAVAMPDDIRFLCSNKCNAEVL